MPLNRDSKALPATIILLAVLGPAFLLLTAEPATLETFPNKDSIAQCKAWLETFGPIDRPVAGCSH